jgi:tetratricopeptide (TPR) repeat protein
VSTRRVFHTILDWAGLGSGGSLLRPAPDEVVMGEAMKPFLSYGWQPQVMAVAGRYKAIAAGRVEAYDLAGDPGETRDVAAEADLPRTLRTALREYPLPALDALPAQAVLSEEDRRKLAALGYVGAAAPAPARAGAPRPADMAPLFDLLERASYLFVHERYAQVIPLLRAILARDPGNLDAVLRLATAHSALGQDAQAEAAFARAQRLAPSSDDVRTYLALHRARGARWEAAVPMLEEIVARSPDRLPALEALAVARERQGRLAEAVELRRRVYALRDASVEELLQLGRLAMSALRTDAAIDAFEAARRQQGAAFAHDLELGVLYLSARRFEDARAALDRVPPSHAQRPMALFKRAQVSVLLGEPDRAARIEAARRGADATTRPLIERERLFQGL